MLIIKIILSEFKSQGVRKSLPHPSLSHFLCPHIQLAPHMRTAYFKFYANQTLFFFAEKNAAIMPTNAEIPKNTNPMIAVVAEARFSGV